MSRSCPLGCNRAHTHRNPKCLAQRRSRHSPPILPKARRKRDQKGTTNRREYSLLCKSGWFDRFNGSELNCCGANKIDGENNEPMHAIIGLPCQTFRSESTLPRIRYDFEYPLRRLLPIRSQSPQQDLQSFFPGMDGVVHANVGRKLLKCDILRVILQWPISFLWRYF